MPKDRADIKKALKKKGFKEVTKGKDHDYYYFYFNDKKISTIFTKLSRGSRYKEISDNLLSKIKRQLKLNKNDFDMFVACPFQKDDYERHLIDLDIITPRDKSDTKDQDS